jgi:PIN domain nuclease of toxin-antitoxin system
MSRILLDTHAFLWFALDDPRLSSTAKASMENPDNELLFSPASYWEIAIKISIGRRVS